jgi:plasmid replication initiation protein
MRLAITLPLAAILTWMILSVFTTAGKVTKKKIDSFQEKLDMLDQLDQVEDLKKLLD